MYKSQFHKMYTYDLLCGPGSKMTVLWCFNKCIIVLGRACSLILIYSMCETWETSAFVFQRRVMVEYRGQLTGNALSPLLSPYCPLQWSCRRCSSVWSPLRRAAGRRRLRRWSASTESRRTAPGSRPAERHNTQSEAALHRALWGYDSYRKITLAISA